MKLTRARSRSRSAPHYVLSLVVAAGMLATPGAHAADTAAAQSLFSDARKLMIAGNFTDACPKLEESEKLDPGMGTLYNLGDCYEHVGKTASAWAAFDEVANEARAAGQPTREQDARTRASALAPQLSHLTIEASSVKDLAGLAVRRDGAEVGAPQWGTPLPVDPGEHSVSATATDKKNWSTTLRVAPHENAVVRIPLLEAAPSPPPPSNFVAPPPEQPADGTTQRTIGVTLAGIGVLAIGTGVVLTLMSKGAEGAANDDGCSPTTNVCPTQAGVDERSTALVEGNISSVVVVSGLVFAASGIALWATAPRSPKSTTGAWHVAPDVAVGQGGASFGMRGRW